jgi:hypothetical protein
MLRTIETEIGEFEINSFSGHTKKGNFYAGISLEKITINPYIEAIHSLINNDITQFLMMKDLFLKINNVKSKVFFDEIYYSIMTKLQDFLMEKKLFLKIKEFSDNNYNPIYVIEKGFEINTSYKKDNLGEIINQLSQVKADLFGSIYFKHNISRVEDKEFFEEKYIFTFNTARKISDKIVLKYLDKFYKDF